MSTLGGGDEPKDTWAEASFLAPPYAVCDWRMVLLFDAAAEAGLLSALPATAGEVAARLDLDGHAVRVVLEALTVWGVVTVEGRRFALGPHAPGADEAAVLRHHARSLRLWASHLDDRLRGVALSGHARHHRRLDLWLDALAVNARASAPAAVDACLARLPEAGRVLDLGGGHGEYALEFARRGLDATVQDRPEVVDVARSRQRLPEAGVRLFADDFFEVLPDGLFDIVFCAGVSYTFDERRNVLLYQRVMPLIHDGGMLVIHTFLRGRGPLAAIFAVQMLGATAGDTHREEDHRRWLGEAGYSSVEVLDLARRPESLLFAAP